MCLHWGRANPLAAVDGSTERWLLSPLAPRLVGALAHGQASVQAPTSNAPFTWPMLATPSLPSSLSTTHSPPRRRESEHGSPRVAISTVGCRTGARLPESR